MSVSKLPSVLAATEEEIQVSTSSSFLCFIGIYKPQLLLAAQCHIGTKNVDTQMEPYVFKRRPDGIHILNIGKTWEKLVLAARIIAAVQNPNDIVAISARPYGHRAVLKFAANTGAQAIAGRFTPGSFTNYITRSFKEPRLIIVTDPRVDHQAIREASYVNIPVIALADTDAPLKFVDVVIPTNNKTRHSIGLIWWLLAREVLRLRGTIPRTSDGWNVMVDMFFYRDPEEVEKQQQEEAAAKLAAVAGAAAPVEPTEWDVGTGTVGAALVGQDGGEPMPVFLPFFPLTNALSQPTSTGRPSPLALLLVATTGPQNPLLVDGEPPRSVGLVEDGIRESRCRPKIMLCYSTKKYYTSFLFLLYLTVGRVMYS